MKREDVEALAQSLLDGKDKVHLCRQCFDLCEGDLCEICQDETRDRSLVCVVEQPQDVAAMERTRGYQGLYHVLHGASPLDGVGPDQLKIRELLLRLQKGTIKEVIIATNSDVEGGGHGQLPGRADPSHRHQGQPHRPWSACRWGPGVCR